jgi:hypothetical protein
LSAHFPQIELSFIRTPCDPRALLTRAYGTSPFETIIESCDASHQLWVSKTRVQRFQYLETRGRYRFWPFWDSGLGPEAGTDSGHSGRSGILGWAMCTHRTQKGSKAITSVCPPFCCQFSVSEIGLLGTSQNGQKPERTQKRLRMGRAFCVLDLERQNGGGVWPSSAPGP